VGTLRLVKSAVWCERCRSCGRSWGVARKFWWRRRSAVWESRRLRYHIEVMKVELVETYRVIHFYEGKVQEL
jgi:hypothetical protein